MGFKKAQRTAAKFKGSIQGGSGSGKTMSALKIATALVAKTDPGKRIALIDSEKSASLYSPPFDFDVDDDFGEGLKASYEPRKLVEKMEAARTAGCYGAVIVDSASHFWKGQGGFNAMIDAIVERQKANGKKADSFAAWKDVDPVYRKVMNYIRNYPMHVFLCIRAKQAYEKVEGANGKGSIKKVGMEPEFREGFEYEMDAQFALDQDHVMVPLKHRLGDFLDGKVFKHPGDDVAEIISEWISQGAPEAAPAEQPKPPVAKAEPQPPTQQPQEISAPATTPTEEGPQNADEFAAAFKAAKSLDELRTLAESAKKARINKKFTDKEYSMVMSPAYFEAKKSLEAKAA